jgi:hypothetical protein
MKRIVLSISLLGMTAAGAPDKTGTPPPARTIDEIVGCRSISDAGQRLACFDRTVGALQDATAKHDIVVVDRQQVRETRRSLFGLSLPNLPIFGDSGTGKDADENRVKEVSSTVRSAREDGAGNWIVILEDGAVWHQTSGDIAIGPKPGTPVTIREAALGSYFMRIGKQPGVKARREN